MANVVVREVCSGGGYHPYVKGEIHLRTGEPDEHTVKDYRAIVRHYEISVNGRRVDSHLSKRIAMVAAKKLANGGKVCFEANNLKAYQPTPRLAVAA